MLWPVDVLEDSLQVLGLLRPARKRRGDFAQKLVFHSGHADMEIGCEA